MNLRKTNGRRIARHVVEATLFICVNIVCEEDFEHAVHKKRVLDFWICERGGIEKDG